LRCAQNWLKIQLLCKKTGQHQEFKGATMSNATKNTTSDMPSFSDKFTIKLTVRQQQILELIQNTIARTGSPPTRAEIATEFGFKSANASEEHLKALARKGANFTVNQRLPRQTIQRAIQLATAKLAAVTFDWPRGRRFTDFGARTRGTKL
jgi:hypothetical protein